MGLELTTLVYKSDAYPTLLSRHVLTLSDLQILMKSCSIESRNDPSPKNEVVHETKFSLKISYSTHVRNVRFVLFTKTSIDNHFGESFVSIGFYSGREP